MPDTLYQIMGRHRVEPLPERKPSWLRVKAPGGENYVRLKGLMKELDLHTVCEEAHCPNVGDCWQHGTATFMIMGDVCTRNCGYCAVAHGRPPKYDLDEPNRVGAAIAEMRLQHAVITSVDRDDLPDGGAGIWARTLEACHQHAPSMTIEVLVPDFKGNLRDVDTVLDAGPDVFAHNLETVPRLSREVRVQARYDRSYAVLRRARERGALVKTGLMLVLGDVTRQRHGQVEAGPEPRHGVRRRGKHEPRADERPDATCALAGMEVQHDDAASGGRRVEMLNHRPGGQIEWAKRRGMIGINPIKEVSKVNIPLLMIHGNVDRRVLYYHMKDYQKAFEAAGKTGEFVTLEGADHFYNTLMFNHQQQLVTKMLDYLANDCGQWLPTLPGEKAQQLCAGNKAQKQAISQGDNACV